MWQVAGGIGIVASSSSHGNLSFNVQRRLSMHTSEGKERSDLVVRRETDRITRLPNHQLNVFAARSGEQKRPAHTTRRSLLC